MTGARPADGIVQIPLHSHLHLYRLERVGNGLRPLLHKREHIPPHMRSIAKLVELLQRAVGVVGIALAAVDLPAPTPIKGAAEVLLAEKPLWQTVRLARSSCCCGSGRADRGCPIHHSRDQEVRNRLADGAQELASGQVDAVHALMHLVALLLVDQRGMVVVVPLEVQGVGVEVDADAATRRSAGGHAGSLREGHEPNDTAWLRRLMAQRALRQRTGRVKPFFSVVCVCLSGGLGGRRGVDDGRHACGLLLVIVAAVHSVQERHLHLLHLLHRAALRLLLQPLALLLRGLFRILSLVG